MVAKKTGLLQELKKDGTPEGIARIENIEELLNGIRDFVEGQKELADTRGSLAEFLEDVALATDLDQDTGDDDRVALMTIHLAKGLEFPYVYIVGMEEDLFPSGMSMNTRSELEHYRYKPLVDADIFGEVDKSKLRLKKPVSGAPPSMHKPSEDQLRKLRKLRPVTNGAKTPQSNLFDNELVPGTLVEHMRFGRGKIVKLEGVGQDKKAEINFDKGGIKKLLLRFAKLKIIG